MKKCLVIIIISLALSTNVKDLTAQTQLISGGLSLFSNITGGLGYKLTGEIASDAQELYNLVANWKCLKARFNFYMNYIANNNDCNFNIDRQKIQDQMNTLDSQMALAGQNVFNMIKGMFSSVTGSNSQNMSQQINTELKSAVAAINDIEQFVDLLCESIRVANNNQFIVKVSGSYSGHEISVSLKNVL
jgi:hypothetical protein